MNQQSHVGPALVTLVVALFLQLLPLPGQWQLWKPDFLLLLVFAWILADTHQFGLLFAALVGLIADVVYHLPLGASVMVYTINAFLLLQFARRASHFSLLQQALLVMLMVAFSQFLRNGVGLSVGASFSWAYVSWSALSSALLWPLVFLPIARMYLAHVRA